MRSRTSGAKHGGILAGKTLAAGPRLRLPPQQQQRWPPPPPPGEPPPPPPHTHASSKRPARTPPTDADRCRVRGRCTALRFRGTSASRAAASCRRPGPAVHLLRSLRPAAALKLSSRTPAKRVTPAASGPGPPLRLAWPRPVSKWPPGPAPDFPSTTPV